MLKYTANTLKNLESLLKEAGYQVRKGKGNFNTGYCILETKNVIVLNRYHTLEAQINAVIELIDKLGIKEEDLSDAGVKWLTKVKNNQEQIEG